MRESWERLKGFLSGEEGSGHYRHAERPYGKDEKNFQIGSRLRSTGLNGDQDEERSMLFKCTCTHGWDPSEDARIGINRTEWTKA